MQKDKIIPRGLIWITDFFLSALVFREFACAGGVFGDYRYLLSLSAVWLALGALTGKINFDRYRSGAYAQSAVIYIDIISYVTVYFVTRIDGFGKSGPDIRIWGLPVIIAMEQLLLFLYVCAVVHKLPTFYENEVIAGGRDKFIDRGAKLNKAPVIAGSRQCSPLLDKIIALDDLTGGMPWEEMNKWIDRNAGELEEFAVVLPDNDVSALQSSGPMDSMVVICKQRLNDAPHLNRFLEKVNSMLPDGGYILCHAVTAPVRRERISKSCPFFIGRIVWVFDFLWSRVMPKLILTRSFYFAVTEGRSRNLTRVEILGRMSRAGFNIVSETQQFGEYYTIGIKVSGPHNEQKPNYGPVIKLHRVGKDGKMIDVYKFRSMYSYSEYIQSYAYSILGLQKGGKFNDDFRVTPYGRLIRRYWIDELPMIVNLLRGDIKLVGVRPLSVQYFSLYTPEMQAYRVTVKPGLIPPFYAEDVIPVTIEDVQESERRYIEAYHRAPFMTDLKYFCKVFVNIVFRHSRSH